MLVALPAAPSFASSSGISTIWHISPSRPGPVATLISIQVAGVAVANPSSTTAIDKQCALYSRCRKIALKRPHIVTQIVAIEAGIVEHDDGACWRRFVTEDR